MLLRYRESGAFATLDGQVLTLAEVVAQQPVDGEGSLCIALPAQRLLHAELELQAHERRHSKALLPWKLEELLLQPVEQMHVSASSGTDGIIGVLAIDKTWLRELLQGWQQAGLRAHELVSELSLLPWQDGQWSIEVQSSVDKADAEPRYLLRHSRFRGMQCSRHNVTVLLDTLLRESKVPPENLAVYGTESDARVLLALLDSEWRERVTFHKALAPVADPIETVNLLQGEFATPLPWQRWWQQWRVAAALILALLLSDFVFTLAALHKARQSLAELEAEIDAQFSAALPGAVQVDPVLQLQRAVAARGGQQANSGFLQLLTRMAPVLQQVRDMQVQSLDYDALSGELHLVIDTDGFTAAENLRANLQSLGLQAELLGSSNDGGRSRSRLRVKA